MGAWKALSVRQPYAWAIVRGFKPVENRDWKPGNPGLRFRGRCLLHAGQRVEKEDVDGVLRQCSHESGTPLDEIERQYRTDMEAAGGRAGIVGAVTITDVVTEMDSDWFYGPIGLLLTKPVAIPFVPCKGALGFFAVPPEVQSALLQERPHA